MSSKNYSILFVTTFLADRVTKFLALRYLSTPITINSLLSLDLVIQPTNIATRAFHVSSSIVNNPLLLISSTVTFVLIIGGHAFFMHKAERPIYGEILCLSSFLSIILDRFVYHGTIDFIRLGPLPVFNLADIFGLIGLCLMIMEIFKSYLVED